MKWLLSMASLLALLGCSTEAFTYPLSKSGASSLRNPSSCTSAASSESVSATITTSTEDEATIIAQDEVSSNTNQLDMLDSALRSNSSAAAEILSQITTMRSSNATQSELESFVQSLVDQVGNAKRSRFFLLARYSRRARRASLLRVLNLSTPPADETDDVNAAKRRRRQSLVVILRSLAQDGEDNGDEAGITVVNSKKGVPAIIQLERAARRKANTVDMEKRMPPGLETPDYKVLTKTSKLEFRHYESFSTCSVNMQRQRGSDETDAKISNPQLAGASAFGALAGYLFGKNQEETAMSMTTPVLSRGEGSDRTMSFVLPSSYWSSLDGAPTPLQESGVQLQLEQACDKAVVMFGGFATKKEVETKTQELLDGLRRNKDWEAKKGAEVSLAQYNDPFTPPWKRRNEVSIKVVSAS